jgi:hypothetical protein
MQKNIFRTALVFALVLMILTANAIQVSASDTLAPKTKTPTPTPTPTSGATTIGNIIPIPVSITSTGGSFVLPSTADIYVEPGTAELTAIANIWRTN